MKIKEGFLLRQVAGDTVVVPVGDAAVDLDLMISLNGSGAFLWQQLQQDTTQEALIAALRQEYEVDEATAQQDVDRFVGKLEQNGLLE